MLGGKIGSESFLGFLRFRGPGFESKFLKVKSLAHVYPLYSSGFAHAADPPAGTASHVLFARPFLFSEIPRCLWRARMGY